MTNISYWAKAHQQSARLAIFTSHILLIIIGLSIGKYLEVEHFSLPKSVEFTAILISMMGLLLYPFRFLYQKSEKIAFFRAKRQMDAAIIAGGFLLSVFIGNHFDAYSLNIPFPAAFAAVAHPNLLMRASSSAILNSPAPDFLLKIAEMKLYMKILLLVGSLAVAVLLAYFIFIAGCSISCAGFTVLANVFMIGGLLFFVTGIILAIHHIFGKKPSSEKGTLLRKIVGIIGLAGWATITTTLMYYMTIAMSMSVGVPLVALLLLCAATYYVIKQFDKQKISE